MFTGINFCFKLIISHYTPQKIKEKKFQTKDKIETQHSFHPTGRPPTLTQCRIHSEKISGCNATICMLFILITNPPFPTTYY